MRTARTLEAKWRQVLRGSVSTWTKEDESSTGRVWGAEFHHVRDRSHLAHFEIYEPFISLISKNFFSGRVVPRITETTDTESPDTGAHLYTKNVRLQFLGAFLWTEHTSELYSLRAYSETQIL
jgi:hypothetical protein